MKDILKILIIEDNLAQRKAMKIALSELNCVFTEARRGEDALQLLEENIFDAIILDIGLPGIGGLETLRRAKSVRVNLEPVIISTSSGKLNNALEAGQLGAFDYILKPYKEEDLKDSIIKATTWKPGLNNSLIKRCFKFRLPGCLYKIPQQKDLIFVGMDFDLNDLYEQGIRPAIESCNLTSWRADEDKRTGDITCKLCGTLQSCKFAVMDMSYHNPNVMFEIGLAYGYGKEVILLKNSTDAEEPIDLSTMHRIEYSSIDELNRELIKNIKSVLEAEPE